MYCWHFEYIFSSFLHYFLYITFACISFSGIFSWVHLFFYFLFVHLKRTSFVARAIFNDNDIVVMTTWIMTEEEEDDMTTYLCVLYRRNIIWMSCLPVWRNVWPRPERAIDEWLKWPSVHVAFDLLYKNNAARRRRALPCLPCLAACARALPALRACRTSSAGAWPHRPGDLSSTADARHRRKIVLFLTARYLLYIFTFLVISFSRRVHLFSFLFCTNLEWKWLLHACMLTRWRHL